MTGKWGKSKENQILFGLWGRKVQANCIQVRGVLLITFCPTFVPKQTKPFPYEYDQILS